jgi:hypothetical protein
MVRRLRTLTNFLGRRQRLVWLGLLLMVWLFCSGQAQASGLVDRQAAFSQWPDLPPLSPARGDLIYPDWLEGNWQLSSTLVGMEAR